MKRSIALAALVTVPEPSTLALIGAWAVVPALETLRKKRRRISYSSWNSLSLGASSRMRGMRARQFP